MLKFLKKKNIIQLPAVEKLNEAYDIVVHIGAPKTGSSAIQKYFCENRSKLLEVGFYYPEHSLDENGVSGGHSALGNKLLDRDFVTAKSILQTYLNEAQQHNCTLLISAEALFIQPTQLKQIVGEHRCKIIAFFRDPLESIYSNYNQGIKRNYATTRLETYCKNMLDKSADFFSGKIFEHWSSTFGKENLMVLGYDLNLFSQTSIQSFFLSALGVDVSIQKLHFKFKPNFVNNSYCLAALELKRMFNFVLDTKQANLNAEIDCFIQSISDKSNYTKYHLAERIDIAIYNKLKEKFASSNQEIRNNYLLELDHNFLKENKPSELRTINHQQLALEMTAILSQLKQQKPKIYNYIEQQIALILQGRKQSYETIKLAEMFNYDLNKIEEKEAWFNQNQLKNMPGMQLVDFYRDIAYLCFYRGDLQNAQLLIERAKEIRPDGPAILELSDQVEQKLKS